MKVIKIIILAITLLSGCASIVRDVSTGEIAAQISTRNCCFCKFIYPASGHVITVDAGRQFVVQKCWGSDSPLYEVTDGNFGTQGKDKDSFRMRNLCTHDGRGSGGVSMSGSVLFSFDPAEANW